MSTKCLLRKRPLCRPARMSIKCLNWIDIAEYANHIPSKNWTQMPKVKYLIFSNLTRKLRGSSSSASLRKRHWHAPMPFFIMGAAPNVPRGSRPSSFGPASAVRAGALRDPRAGNCPIICPGSGIGLFRAGALKSIYKNSLRRPILVKIVAKIVGFFTKSCIPGGFV